MSFLGFERQFGQQIVRGMALVTGKLGMRTHFLGNCSFLHYVTTGAKRSLISCRHGVR
jgi:hypothetical protein